MKRSLLFVLIVLLILIVLPSPVLAWGSVTHSAICRAAGGGDEYAMGGVAPDMIALYSVTTGDDTYDYAHNLYGNKPTFGSLLVETNRSSFARGWRAHQVADSVVHGVNGYSNTKRLLTALPAGLSGDINHGIVELLVDAIVLKEYYGGTCAISIPQFDAAIHETAVHFYNNGCRGSIRIPREAIIGCRTARGLTADWNVCLSANLGLAVLITREPWFDSVTTELADFRPLYSISVNKVIDGGNVVYGQANKTKPKRNVCLDFVMPAGAAYAAEPEDSAWDEPAGYYSFLSELGRRAQADEGAISEASIKNALAAMAADPESSPAQQEWVKTLSAMTSGKNKNAVELEGSVEAALNDAGSVSKGKGNGPRANLPTTGVLDGLTGEVSDYLPCASAASASFAAVVLVWRRKRRR